MKKINRKHPLTAKEFFNLFSKVARVTTDLYIETEQGILLLLRETEPYINNWYFPGGTIIRTLGDRFDTIEENTKRIAREELGCDIEVEEFLGFASNTKEIRDGVPFHSINLIFKCKLLGDPSSEEKFQYFKSLPEQIIPQHKIFIEKLKNDSKLPIIANYPS